MIEIKIPECLDENHNNMLTEGESLIIASIILNLQNDKEEVFITTYYQDNLYSKTKISSFLLHRNFYRL